MSAWWIFHYPHNCSRAFAPAFVQAHRQRERGVEEEEEEMERGGVVGLEGEQGRVVRGLVWGCTVWRRPAVGDGEGGAEV